MQAETLERSQDAAPTLHVAFPGKYLSLTSFRRDGTGVVTLLWFVADGDRLLIMTDPHSFKAKRIRRNPHVTIAPCSARGRLLGEPVRARAEVLPDGELPRVEQLMWRKYRFDRVAILPIYRLVRRLRGTPVGTDECAIAITLDP